MSNEDKALTFATQINHLQQEIMNSDKGKLQHAIEAGELLIRAKETVGSRKWSEWRERNCPKVPQTTASLYMRLATHKAIFSKQRVASLEAGGDLSLRAASKLIPKDPEKVAAAKQRKAEKEAAAAAAAEEKGGQAAIKELLDWCAEDELFLVMKIVWEEDQIKKLADLLVDHLKSKPAPAPHPEAGMQAAPQPQADMQRRM
jgi:hypothetical protein